MMVEIGEVKTNVSEKSVDSVINQLSVRAALVSFGMHLLAPNSCGMITARVYLQTGIEGIGSISGLVKKNESSPAS